MELYFYHLSDGKVFLDSCEVKEKPQTYWPVKRFPGWFYRSFIRKGEIGEVIGYDKNVVVLTEKDDKRAYSVLADRVRRKIEKNKDIIRSMQISNERLLNTLQMLELF